MTFDVRWPIGLLFLAIGALVAAAGLFGVQPAGPNIDLDWGGIMILFGAAMVLLAALARGSGRAPED
jgi:hypothetical protein